MTTKTKTQSKKMLWCVEGLVRGDRHQADTIAHGDAMCETHLIQALNRLHNAVKNLSEDDEL